MENIKRYKEFLNESVPVSAYEPDLNPVKTLDNYEFKVGDLVKINTKGQWKDSICKIYKIDDKMGLIWLKDVQTGNIVNIKKSQQNLLQLTTEQPVQHPEEKEREFKVGDEVKFTSFISTGNWERDTYNISKIDSKTGMMWLKDKISGNSIIVNKSDREKLQLVKGAPDGQFDYELFKKRNQIS